VSEAVSDPPRPGADRASGRRSARSCASRWARFGIVLVILVVVLGAAFAPLLTQYEPSALSPRDRFLDPSAAHLLGTDQLGRDLFSRVLHGGRIALYVALVSTAISLALGIVLGLIAGYGPRWLDNVMILLFDALKSFPTVMLALALVTLTGPSLTAVMVVVILVNVPGYARIIRTQTIALKSSEFVTAAQSMGATPPDPAACTSCPTSSGRW
jgi:peptide/nickel transport system permease protein